MCNYFISKTKLINNMSSKTKGICVLDVSYALLSMRIAEKERHLYVSLIIEYLCMINLSYKNIHLTSV